MSISCLSCTYDNLLHNEKCEICNKPLYRDRINSVQDTTQLNIEPKMDEGERKINENFTQALDIIPESFSRVNMLYIRGNINGKLLNIFIDTGAQITIMSEKAVKKCGLGDLVDKKYKGKVIGVGSQEILGKVHYAEIDLNSVIIPYSFTILKQRDIDIILGLDMLLGHQAEINLAKKTIKFGKVEIDFLPEHLLSKK
jgi:DNA damage-inducible protein 1